jgi:hypothetical protein
MKKLEEAEFALDLSYLGEPEHAGPLAAVSAGAVLVDKGIETIALDAFVAGLRWAFIYVPGAVTIHMVVMTSVLMLPRSDSPVAILLEGLGTFLVAAFLIMFGIGKLQELKYFRVVGTIFATSVVSAVISTIAGAFMPTGWFQWVFFFTMPLTVLAGYLAKRNTDAGN